MSRNDQRRTKTERRRHFRWLFVILPFSTAVGFRVLSFLAPDMPLPFSSAFAFLLQAPVELRVAAWLVLAALCAVHTALWVAADNGLSRGMVGIIATTLMTIAALGGHVMACFFFLFLTQRLDRGRIAWLAAVPTGQHHSAQRGGGGE